MEISNFGLIISTSLVIFGWFINSHLNRREEKIKKQIEYRIIALESFLPIAEAFSKSSAPFEYDKDLTVKIEQSITKFVLYGYQDEIDLYKKFTKALEKGDLEQTKTNVNKLIKITRDKLRKELLLPTVKI